MYLSFLFDMRIELAIYLRETVITVMYIYSLFM